MNKSVKSIVAATLAALIVLFSPGLSCYQALAATFENSGGVVSAVVIAVPLEQGINAGNISAGVPNDGSNGSLSQELTSPSASEPAPRAAKTGELKQAVEDEPQAALESTPASVANPAPSGGATAAPGEQRQSPSARQQLIFSAAKLKNSRSDGVRRGLFTRIFDGLFGKNTATPDSDLKLSSSGTDEKTANSARLSLPAAKAKEDPAGQRTVPTPDSIVLQDLIKNPPAVAIFDYDGTLNEFGPDGWGLPPSQEIVDGFSRLLEDGLPVGILTGRSFDHAPADVWAPFISRIRPELRKGLFFAGQMGLERVQFDSKGEPLRRPVESWTPDESKKISAILESLREQLKIATEDLTIVPDILRVTMKFKTIALADEFSRKLAVEFQKKGITSNIYQNQEWIYFGKSDKGQGLRRLLADMHAQGFEFKEKNVLLGGDEFKTPEGRRPGGDAAAALAAPTARVVSVGGELKDERPANVHAFGAQRSAGMLQVIEAVHQGWELKRLRPSWRVRIKNAGRAMWSFVANARNLAIAGVATTGIAWALGAPYAAVAALSAATGLAAGLFLIGRPKINAFFSRSLMRQILPIVAVAGLYLFMNGLTPALAIPLIAVSSGIVTLGITPLLVQGWKTYVSISENLHWLFNFWKQVDRSDAGILKLLHKSSALAVASAFAAIVPSKLLGEIFERFNKLHPIAAAGTHAGLIHLLDPALHTFYIYGALLLAAYAFKAFTGYRFSRAMYDIGNRMMKGMTDRFMRHVLNLPLSWHSSHPAGDIISTVQDGIYNMQNKATSIIVDSIKDIVFIAMSFGGMMYFSWQMTLFFAPFLVIALAIPTSVFSEKTSKAYQVLFRKLKPWLMSIIQQIGINIETVKSAGREEVEMDKVSVASELTYIKQGNEITNANAPYRALAGGLTDIGMGLVLLSLIPAYYLGYLTIAAATMYYLLAGFYRDAMQDMSGNYIDLSSLRGIAKKHDSIMDTSEEDYHLDGAKLPKTSSGRSIDFDHVSFGYNKGEANLKEVTFSVKPGEMVALVGPSGSGKTTITRLLLSTFKPQEGAIRIDAKNLDELNLKNFRQETGSILQSPEPFDESIAHNIRYLRPDASEAQVLEAVEKAGLYDDVVALGYRHALQASEREVDGDVPKILADIKTKIVTARRILLGEQAPDELNPEKSVEQNISLGFKNSFAQIADAAKKAGLHDDIVRLGLNSRVGERGVTLSGGQKQRLLLARLFAAYGDIMILDEPTAALDGIMQLRVQQTLEAVHGKATVVLVAHRLSTVQGADRIIVFNKGSIVEQGSHEELIKRGGLYARMWEVQKLEAEVAQHEPQAAH